MKRAVQRYILLLGLVIVPVAGLAEPAMISSELWASPRSGAAISRLPSLVKLVALFETASDSKLVIYYPGGDEGLLKAEELRAWLISLGLSSAHLELRVGVAEDQEGHNDNIRIEIKPNRI